jgi:hypothetical protein
MGGLPSKTRNPRNHCVFSGGFSYEGNVDGWLCAGVMCGFGDRAVAGGNVGIRPGIREIAGIHGDLQERRQGAEPKSLQGKRRPALAGGVAARDRELAVTVPSVNRTAPPQSN